MNDPEVPRREPAGASLDRFVGPISLLAIFGIGGLDYVTGPEIGLSPLYLAPVSLAAWRRGKGMGLAMAVAAAIVWLVADLAADHYSHTAIAYWNAFVRFTMFGVVAVLFAHVRALTESLKQKVAQQSARLSAEITWHHLTRDVLRNTESQFRILVEGVRDLAIFLLDSDGCIDSWNHGAEVLTGYSAREMLGSPFSRLWRAGEVQHAMDYDLFDRALDTGTAEGQGWCVRRDGSRFWALTVLTALRDDQGTVHGFSQMIHNITERKHLENELLAKEEAERQRIGRDLHDVLGQDLTALALLGKELEQRLADCQSPASTIAGRLTHSANQAIKHVRALARGLSVHSIEARGLSEALADLALSASDVFSVRCVFANRGRLPSLDATLDLHLYRIAQEAITNAVKHGEARSIFVSLATEGDYCTLRIEDDGAGLPQDSATCQGSGMAIMKYRARAMGGTLSLERLSPRGTAVACCVPRQFVSGD